MVPKNQACLASRRRRGAVAVQVMITATVMLGFAALTVDVGAMYNARAELQRTADAASLAAAAVLSDFESGDPVELARARAVEFAGRNTVFGQPMQVDPFADVTVGRAYYDADTNTYLFTPTDILPDAVRVRVRMTGDSPNGAFPLFFAGLLGATETELSAEAIAMMVPRDIAIVADLSASHNDDSELQHYQLTDINLLEVWGALPIQAGVHGVGDGISPPPPGQPGIPPPPPPTPGPVNPGNGGNDPGTGPLGMQIGPTWGWLYYWGNTIDESFDPSADPGLIDLPRYQTWRNTDLVAWLENVGYSKSEIKALMSDAYDGSRDSWGQYAWTNRVAVALGLARWDSGHPGGLWESIPPEQRHNGNGNNWVGAGELTWLVDYPFDSGSWSSYIYYYVRRSNTKMARANPDFQYKFGLKTFINYLLERKPRNVQTPELAGTPAQPMQAVKDAVQHMVELIDTLDTSDQLSLEIYGTTARHEVDLTNDYFQVSDRLNSMQAGHYDTYTNMGGGIARGIEELTSDRARTTSRKVIILLTDGKANVSASGSYGVTEEHYAAGAAYAVEQAQAAAELGIQIFAVSVGADADLEMMQQIAEIGHGEHFHATGSIDEYSAQLDVIFRTLGGQRQVELIQ